MCFLYCLTGRKFLVCRSAISFPNTRQVMNEHTSGTSKLVSHSPLSTILCIRYSFTEDIDQKIHHLRYWIRKIPETWKLTTRNQISPSTNVSWFHIQSFPQMLLFLNKISAFISGRRKFMNFVASGRFPSFVITSYRNNVNASINLSSFTAKKRPGLLLETFWGKLPGMVSMAKVKEFRTCFCELMSGAFFFSFS